MTIPTQVQSSPRHHGSSVLLTALLWLSVVATFLTALALGWLQISFQLFGEQADRGDYAMASGMYGFGALLLTLTPAVAVLLRLPLGSSFVAAAGCAVLVFLAGDAALHASVMSSSPVAESSWPEGTMFLALVPWVWALPVMTLAGVLTRVSSRSWDSRTISTM